MDRGDFRHIKPLGLPLQMSVVRVLRQGLGKPVGDFAPQFGRSGFRVGYHQKIVDIRRVPGVQKVRKQPFHQHSRLAGACRRRDKQRPAPILYGQLLVTCESHDAPPR